MVLMQRNQYRAPIPTFIAVTPRMSIECVPTNASTCMCTCTSICTRYMYYVPITMLVRRKRLTAQTGLAVYVISFAKVI